MDQYWRIRAAVSIRSTYLAVLGFWLCELSHSSCRRPKTKRRTNTKVSLQANCHVITHFHSEINYLTSTLDMTLHFSCPETLETRVLVCIFTRLLNVFVSISTLCFFNPTTTSPSYYYCFISNIFPINRFLSKSTSILKRSRHLDLIVLILALNVSNPRRRTILLVLHEICIIEKVFLQLLLFDHLGIEADRALGYECGRENYNTQHCKLHACVVANGSVDVSAVGVTRSVVHAIDVSAEEWRS